MHYWVRSGLGEPEYLSAEDVALRVAQGSIGWQTPACQAGAQAWTTVGNIPELVAAVRPPPPPPAIAPAPPPRAFGAPTTALPIPGGHSDVAKHAEQLGGLKAQIAAAQQDLAVSIARLNTLRQELGAVEEAVELQSFGFYQPRYGFESSGEYAARLVEIRKQQEQMPCPIS